MIVLSFPRVLRVLHVSPPTENLLSFSGHISSYGLVVDLWSEMGRYHFKSILPSMVSKSNCRIFFVVVVVSTKFSM